MAQIKIDFRGFQLAWNYTCIFKLHIRYLTDFLDVKEYLPKCTNSTIVICNKSPLRSIAGLNGR